MQKVTSQFQNSKRIVKNTMFLYFRHLFIMFISFFSARIVLDKLGVVDFGIQNVVGGMAGMFAFFRSSLSNATQRFLSIALGKNSEEELSKTFRQHQSIYIAITLVVLFLLETVGLYFFWHKLVIPENRMNAAFWVFQLTTASLCVTLLSVVYNAVLIAHENMKIYSYVSIFEAFAKLAIAYGIVISPVDRLITYAFLLFCVSLCIRLFYTCYCKRMYKECSFKFLWSIQDIKHAFSFISWNFIGTAVWAINNNGIDILLNMFFGPVVNAAKGVASQVCTAVNNFSNGFLVSVQPQLIKSYAAKDYDYLYSLFFKSSKFSFLLLWFFCFPLFFVIDDVLEIWLKEVPYYANSFVFLILVYSLVNSLDQPIWTLVQAVGKLKNYICIGSGVFLMVFPISYILLKLGFSPNSVFETNIIIRCVYIITVFIIIRRYIFISVRRYFKETILPIAEVSIVSIVCMIGLKNAIIVFASNHWVTFFVAFVLNIVTICLFGLSKDERNLIKTKILRRIRK